MRAADQLDRLEETLMENIFLISNFQTYSTDSFGEWAFTISGQAKCKEKVLSETCPRVSCNLKETDFNFRKYIIRNSRSFSLKVLGFSIRSEVLNRLILGKFSLRSFR